MDTEELTCIRCGVTSEISAYRVSDIPVCDTCLANQTLKRKIAVFPPKNILWKKIRPIIAVMIIGFILVFFGVLYILRATGIPLLSIEGFMALFLSSLFAMLALEALGVILFYSRIQHTGMEAWKEQLVSEFSLEELVGRPSIHHHLVTYALQRPKWSNITFAVSTGLMIESPQGLFFIDKQGVCKMLALKSIVSISTERLMMLPSRTALLLHVTPECAEHLELADNILLVTCIDQATFRADKAKTLAFADRWRA